MKVDAELLREFVERDAESAFAALVERHINVVYSAACRETWGDLSLAQDVAQLVFIELARQASRLRTHPTLAGWLYTTVRHVASNLRRTDRRRMNHEEQARAEHELLRQSNDPLWGEIRPVLDDAMHELSEEDRGAVLLRYFEDRTFREVGDELGLTEGTARKKVERALEKLRTALGQRGVHSTGSALTAALAVGMVAAPSPLAATVTSSALAAAAVSTASFSGLLGVVTASKSVMVGLAAVAVATGSLGIWQQQRHERLVGEHDATSRKQLEQVAQLREEKEQLSEALQAAEDRVRDVPSELRILRGQVAVLRRRLEAEKGKGATLPGMDSWRQQFEAAYRLRDDEVLKRIGPPFIRERTEYLREEWSPLGRPWKSGKDYLVLCQNGQELCERFRAYSIAANRAELGRMLSELLTLKRYEFEGPDEVLNLAVRGDWVLRKGASRESQMAAFAAIVREATGRNIQFEKQMRFIDVVVVRGSPVPVKGQIIDIFSENRNYITGQDFHRGKFDKFLEYLEERLNVRVVSDEVRIPDPASLYCWFPHPDANGLRAGDRRLQLIKNVIENLRRQTPLSFELERRSSEVWLVRDQDQSPAPPGSPMLSQLTKFGS